MNQTIYAGIMTGMISQSITWPMEYAKIKRQMNGKSIMDNFKYEYNKYGFRGFTRGLGSHLGGGIPRVTLRFYTFDFLTKNGIENKMTAGFISGIMESCLIYTPSEYLKIQAMKNNTLRMLKPKIYQNPKVLFKGLLPTIVRTGTNQAVCFTFYDNFNEHFSSTMGHNGGKLVTGSLGAITAVMVNNPIDVIKTKTQASNSNILLATKNIITNDGILGFWKGGFVRSIRMAPLYGLNFFLFDYFSGK